MASRHRLSQHFTVEEFDCHDGNQIPSHWYPDFTRVCAWWLEPLRAEFGPVKVMSGYRTVNHNRAVGGAIASVHLVKTPLPPFEPHRLTGEAPAGRKLAVAADVVCSKGDPARWAAWARKYRKVNRHLGPQGRGGVGEYVAGGFAHLDTASLRDWRG